jgi:hypothetical protein
MGYICDALLDNVGLISLVVWNNGITHESSPTLAKVLVNFFNNKIYLIRFLQLLTF